MTDTENGLIAKTVQNQQEGMELLEKLAVVAQPGAVYSEPVTAGDYTVITASEVSVAMGYGFGLGGGSSPEGDEAGHGYGGGGGGGGVSSGRPVAVISVGPRGVSIEPVVDPTKLGLAFFTMLVTIIMTFRRRK